VRSESLARPVVSLGDPKLLAEAVYYALWSQCGLASPDADARLADGPQHDVQPGDGTAEALAALLWAIRDLPAAQQEISCTRNYLDSDWHRIVTIGLRGLI
jgi:hypothetical protein